MEEFSKKDIESLLGLLNSATFKGQDAEYVVSLKAKLLSRVENGQINQD